MAKISQLPEAETVTDKDVLPIVQNSVTKQISRSTFVGTVPSDLQITDNHLQLTANGEAVGDGAELPKATNESAGIIQPGSNLFIDSAGLLQEKGYELWSDITLTEDINEVVRTVDDNGNALNIRKFFLVFVGNFTPGVAFPMILRFNDGVIYSHYKSITFPETTTKNTFWIKVEKYADGIVRSTYSNGFIGGTSITDGVIKNQGFAQSAIDCASNFFITYPATQNKYTKITKWHFGAHPSSEGQMLAGSRILVMGVRA